jgi:hypothetical protein
MGRRLIGGSLPNGAFQVEPDSICLVLFDGAGVSLLLRNADFGKSLNNDMWLDL